MARASEGVRLRRAPNPTTWPHQAMSVECRFWGRPRRSRAQHNRRGPSPTIFSAPRAACLCATNFSRRDTAPAPPLSTAVNTQSLPPADSSSIAKERDRDSRSCTSDSKIRGSEGANICSSSHCDQLQPQVQRLGSTSGNARILAARKWQVRAARRVGPPEVTENERPQKDIDHPIYLWRMKQATAFRPYRIGESGDGI